AAAGFLEAQAHGTEAIGYAMAHRESVEAAAQHRGIDPERIANAIESEGMVGAAGDDPLGGLGECATLAHAAEAIPALQDIDGVNEDGEHQALLAAEPAAAHRAEELARQDDIGRRHRIQRFTLALRLIHCHELLLRPDAAGPIRTQGRRWRR